MYRLFVAVCILALLLCSAAQAKPGLPDDPDMLELMRKLASKPELMNIEYLQYVIGLPEQGPPIGGAQIKSQFWYGAHHKLMYELHQQESYPGQVISSDFLMHFPESQVSFKKMEHELGTPIRRFYDPQCHPAVLCSLAPNTSLTLHSHRGAFGVKRVAVAYRGAPLPNPSPADIKLASDKMVERMEQAADRKKWDVVMPLAIVELRNHPDDAEAHYLLGRCYASQGNLAQAINEYKAGLAAIPPSNPAAVVSVQQQPAVTWASQVTACASGDIKQNCLRGLKELKVKEQSPDDELEAANQRRNIKLFQHAQRLRVGGSKTVDPDKAESETELPVSNQGNR